MARPKTAQPNHSLRKVAAVVATAVSGMSVYAQAAEQPKQEETITVVAARPPEAPGDRRRLSRQTLRHGDQNRYPD